MDIEQKYELIERYLEQKMTGEERTAFEKLTENDPDLKEELELHKQVAATLKSEKMHAFRNVLKETDQNWKSDETIPKTKIKRIDFRAMIGVAATVLFLLWTYLFFFSGGGQLSNEQLFAANFQPYQMLLSQRDVAGEEKNVLLENAITAYSRGDFQNASIAFQQLAETEPGNISFRFYQAVAELGAMNSDSAIVLFKEIHSYPDHPFVEQSRWYLALAYLQNGDAKNAVDQLAEIRQGQFKYGEARKLLQSME